MGLFQKKPKVLSSAPLYTLGLKKNLLVVGLGNPEKRYTATRHNIGFAVVDELAKRLEFPQWKVKKEFKGLLSEQSIGENKVILLKSTTYMNLSGEAVGAVAKFYKVPNHLIVVVYDELDIPFGQIRTRIGGSSAGHNGAQSVIKNIGEDFGRVRVGIKNNISAKAEGKDFVLGKFTKMEQAELPALLKESTSILSEFVNGQPITPETRSFLI